MSRLYIPKKPKKITRGDSEPQNPYIEKVVKLIPSEIIAGYLAIKGLMPLVQTDDTRLITEYSVFGLCVLLTPAYFIKIFGSDNVSKEHLTISTLAFIVWGVTISGHDLLGTWYDPALGSIILIGFTLISAIFPFKGEE